LSSESSGRIDEQTSIRPTDPLFGSTDIEENPFPGGTNAHRIWADSALLAKERLALFAAEQLGRIPAENAPDQDFMEFRVASAASVFDIWVGVFSESMALTDDAANAFGEMCGEFEKIFNGVAEQKPMTGILRRTFLSTMKTRLRQRKHFWIGQTLKRVREHKQAAFATSPAVPQGNYLERGPKSVQPSTEPKDVSTESLHGAVGTAGSAPYGIAGATDIPELPLKFQKAFEAARAKADLECHVDGTEFSHVPQVAAFSEMVWIQKIFFAYCEQARNALREGHWTMARVRNALDAAWLGVFDSCFDREHPSASDARKSEVRSALRKTVVDDPRWKQHLTELAALAERAVTAPSMAGSAGSKDPNATNIELGENTENQLARTNAGSVLGIDPFAGSAASLLGDNPFPPEHPAHSAFEEAKWKAKSAIEKFKVEFLTATPETLVDYAVVFRRRCFSSCAFEATLIVCDQETAKWYEQWLEGLAKSMLEETMSAFRKRDPKLAPSAPPVFSEKELADINDHLTIELLKMVAHYKSVCARRVTEAIDARRRLQESETGAHMAGDMRPRFEKNGSSEVSDDNISPEQNAATEIDEQERRRRERRNADMTARYARFLGQDPPRAGRQESCCWMPGSSRNGVWIRRSAATNCRPTPRMRISRSLAPESETN
jgi:hypothetical protein